MIYKTRGTCSVAINIELDGDTVKKAEFIGGCHGNTQGVAALVEGMKCADVLERLEGITCGGKPTSCPDQLCKAIRKAMEQTA